MKDQPLISCLCVTRGRVPLLKRAVGSFRDQDYGNTELVVVYESDDSSTAEYLRGLSDENILKIEVPAEEGLTLGELRNLSVSLNPESSMHGTRRNGLIFPYSSLICSPVKIIIK